MRIVSFALVFALAVGLNLACGDADQRNEPGADAGSDDAGADAGSDAGPGSCTGVACTTPPASVCIDANRVRTFAPQGTCSNGSCSYTATDTACANGCGNGACSTEAMVDGACGPAATTYPSSSTAYAGALCAAGTASPPAPAFPAAGSSSSWTCQGSGGGVASGTCTAGRQATGPVAGPNECVIGGVVYPSGAAGPGPGCQSCLPDVSQSDFSPCGPLSWKIAWPAGRGRASFVSIGGGRVLMAGGLGGSMEEAYDALVFDGHRWIDESAAWLSLPGPRVGGVAAWDSKRGRAVLFGGNDYQGTTRFPGATHERDAAGTWTTSVAEGSGPSPRIGHAMAYDERRGVTVLFGGTNANSLNLADTWEYDGLAWKRLAIPGPTPRSGHALAYDAGRQKVVLHGGTDGNTVNGDVWEYDGTAWVQVGNGPVRAFHGMAYDTRTPGLLVFGGRSTNTTAVVAAPMSRKPDGTWFALPDGPSAVVTPAVTHDPVLGRTYVWSGSDSLRAPPDLWAWTGTDWLRLGSQPGPRSGASMAYDSTRQRTVLAGGFISPYNGVSSELTDTWEWDGFRWEQRATASAPTPWRARGMMAYDPVRKRLALFGGANGQGSLNDTWLWDGQGWKELTIPAANRPPVDVDGAMAYSAELGGIVLMRGEYLSDKPSELWLLGDSTWTRLGPGTAANRYFSMTEDGQQGVLICGGGSGSGSLLRLFGGALTRLALPADQTCMYDQDGIVHVSRRAAIVVLNAINGASAARDNGSWSSLPGGLPSWRGGSLVADPLGAVTFGGTHSGGRGEQYKTTWVIGR